MRTWVRSELGTIGHATFAIAGFPSRKWDVHGIYYRKIKLQVAKESYISRKWKLFVRFVDKMETFPPQKWNEEIWYTMMMFHLSVLQKTVGGFGCVILGHKSFTMAFSIIFPFPLVSTPHQWRPPKVSVTAIGLSNVQLLKKQRSRDKPLGTKAPVSPAAQICE